MSDFVLPYFLGGPFGHLRTKKHSEKLGIQMKVIFEQADVGVKKKTKKRIIFVTHNHTGPPPPRTWLLSSRFLVEKL